MSTCEHATCPFTIWPADEDELQVPSYCTCECHAADPFALPDEVVDRLAAFVRETER